MTNIYKNDELHFSPGGGVCRLEIERRGPGIELSHFKGI
jgi:hypothetical protein